MYHFKWEMTVFAFFQVGLCAHIKLVAAVREGGRGYYCNSISRVVRSQ